MTNDRKRLLSIVRDFYGRVVYSHKTYEKDRELCTQKATRDKWINVILMALTTTGVIASIPLGTTWTTVVAALLAFISTGFAIYQISFTPELEIQRYRSASKELLLERDRLVLLIERIMDDSTNLEDLREDFQRVSERVHAIYASSPDTSSEAFKLASKGLKVDDELSFTDDEVDQFLPNPLRVGGSNTPQSP